LKKLAKKGLSKAMKKLLKKQAKARKAAKKAAAKRAKALQKAMKKRAAAAKKRFAKAAADRKRAAKKLANLQKMLKGMAKRPPPGKRLKQTRKQLKAARDKQMKAEAQAWKIKQKLLALKRRNKARLREEKRKCSGKCSREFPILVGPKNVPNKETRSVVVIGDSASNRKRYNAVPTSKKLLWDPKKLKKTVKHIKKAAGRIVAARTKTKRISEAPLVEKPL